MAELEDVDWTGIDWEDSLTCACGRQFRSASRYVAALERVVSRRPCPGCGRQDRIVHAEMDPETFTVER